MGRFTQQDTWMGRNHDPITLHKYLYANADPVRYTDPTGNFSIVGAMKSVSTLATLVTVADNSYSLGSALYGSVVHDEPLDFSAENIKQIGFAVVFSYGAAKVLKLMAKSKKFKKLFKERKLMRGVNNKNAAYNDAVRGYVAGSYLGYNPWSTRKSQREKHNSGKNGTWNTVFTSWTTKRRIAMNFATRDASVFPDKRSHGVIITAKIMSFRIFKSPDRQSILGLGKEGEWLVVGPVQGIPRPVK